MRGVLIFTILISFPVFGETIALKFEEIGILVHERNQHVKGATLQGQAAEAGKGHLARSFLPRVGIKAGSEAFKTGSQKERSEPFGAVEAKLNLYRGGRDSIEDQAVDLKAKAVGAEVDQAVRNEIRKARIGYWNLIAERELISLLKDGVHENERNQKAAQGRIRAGISTDTDRIEFEMHQLALDQDLARASLTAANTERALVILLGLPEGTSVETAKAVGHDHTDRLLASPYKIEDHPSVSSISFRAEEASLEKARIGRWWAPSVDAFAGYALHTFREREFDPQSERFETVVGVQISIDLFDGMNARREALQRSLRAEGLRFEHQQTAREFKAKTEAGKAELKLTHELIHQSEDSLKKSNTYLARTLDEYRRGVKNSPDVLSASERNLQMKRRFAELRRDYQLARVQLMEILGE